MFWSTHGIAHGLFALILDWSKAEVSKLYYFAFVLVTFNPTRCNGDFLTRLISRASPQLQNFLAISDWLMDCLRSFWLVKVIFYFFSWSMQSDQVQWWLSHAFSRASRRLHTLLRIVFYLLSYLCSLWLVKVNYFAFVPATLNWKPF